ncbi:MAG: hypothetical protein ACLUZZ_00190 [Alistipes inops]
MKRREREKGCGCGCDFKKEVEGLVKDGKKPTVEERLEKTRSGAAFGRKRRSINSLSDYRPARGTGRGAATANFGSGRRHPCVRSGGSGRCAGEVGGMS